MNKSVELAEGEPHRLFRQSDCSAAVGDIWLRLS